MQYFIENPNSFKNTILETSFRTEATFLLLMLLLAFSYCSAMTLLFSAKLQLTTVLINLSFKDSFAHFQFLALLALYRGFTHFNFSYFNTFCFEMLFCLSELLPTLLLNLSSAQFVLTNNLVNKHLLSLSIHADFLQW